MHGGRKIKQTQTTGDGRRRLRLPFITEQNVALQTRREVLSYLKGLYALR